MINSKLIQESLGNTYASVTSANIWPHTCNLDPEKLKQLQQQDEYKNELPNASLPKNKKTPYYLDEHGITYRKIRQT